MCVYVLLSQVEWSSLVSTRLDHSIYCRTLAIINKPKPAQTCSQKPTWRVSRATRLRVGSSGVKHTVMRSLILMGFPDIGHSTVLLLEVKKKRGGENILLKVHYLAIILNKIICECTIRWEKLWFHLFLWEYMNSHVVNY